MTPDSNEPEKNDEPTLADDIAEGGAILGRVVGKLGRGLEKANQNKMLIALALAGFGTNGYHFSVRDAVNKAAGAMGVDCVDTRTYEHVMSVMNKMCTDAEVNHQQCKSALEACGDMPDERL